jgi:hypothetical protein
MAERLECEFYLVKYVPDPVRNEFVHVGVVLRTVEGRESALRFTSDWRRVRCLDPGADTEMLEGLQSELRRRFQGEPEGGGGLMRLLEDSFSNSVQITRAKGYLAESVEAGVEELMRLYVEPQKVARTARVSGRAAIQARMRGEFERAGVWDLLRKRIAAADYTRAGDPLRIDLGYRTNVGGERVRMFQVVSLEAGLGIGSGSEMAKALAFSAAGLRAGVMRVEKAELELTAVVEALGRGIRERQGIGNREQGVAGEKGSEVRGQGSGIGQGIGAEMGSEGLAAYRFAVEAMEEHGIRVLTTADLGRVAETARRELRA